MTITTITAKRMSTHPVTGLQRFKINAKDTAKLMEWDEFDPSQVRGSRGVRKDGTLHFTTGVGYAIFDADLLGGTGDGSAERRFRDAGFIIRYV